MLFDSRRVASFVSIRFDATLGQFVKPGDLDCNNVDAASQRA